MGGHPSQPGEKKNIANQNDHHRLSIEALRYELAQICAHRQMNITV